MFPVLFCKSSICWNPVIYVALNSQFRNALTPEAMLKGNIKRCHSALRTEQRSKRKSTSRMVRYNDRRRKRNNKQVRLTLYSPRSKIERFTSRYLGAGSGHNQHRVWGPA